MADGFQLYGADNRPILTGDGVRTPLIGSVVPDQLALRWYSQVSKGLDPVTLGGILDEAVSGAIERQFKLFEEMEEKFPELRLALLKHKLKVARRSWQITPPDRPRNPDLAKKKTEFAEQSFGEIKDFSRTMFNLLDAVGKNLSACEIQWAVESSSVSGPRSSSSVSIERMPWVNYRHLYYAPDRPELMLRPDLQSYNYFPFTHWPKKFVVFEHLTKSGHAARGAMLRPVAWAFMLYLFATKDLAALVETFGVDVAFAYYRPGADKKEQDDVLMHVQRIAIRAGAFPEGTKIELERAAAGSGGGSPQENSVRYYADLVTKLFLGSTLATTAGDKGARSLGEVQDEETVEMVDWSAVLVAETISDTALAWLCGFNFAEPGDNPWFQLPAAKRKDLQALANVINLLVRVGARIPEKWTHSEFDIPEPAEGEEEMILKAEVAPAAGAVAGGQGTVDSVKMQSLTGRALGFSTITEHQAQAVLDDLRAQAVKKSQDIAAFDQLTGPLKKLIARTVDPKVALAELDAVAKEIKPEKLAGVLEQVIILSDLVGRAVVNEQTKIPQGGAGAPRTLVAGASFDPNQPRAEDGQWAEEEKRGLSNVDKAHQTKGDVMDAMSHRDLGSIDFRWGETGDAAKNFEGGHGFAKIIAKHGLESARRVPITISRGAVAVGKNRAFIEHEGHRVVLDKTWNGQPSNHWVLSGYEKENG
ncbi:MAG: DUF935 family protein [Verrucomicrobia bacterium]|nr:DUF935 family protein [Verrucomicrobiota bacterium]